MVYTGLARLIEEPALRGKISGAIGYLCHSASVDRHLEHGAEWMKRLFGKRLKALFAPQHGFATDAQDNMIESPHFVHPHFQLPVYSLYSETRVPTPEMLSGLDHLVIDLQDAGVRVYTYIWTMVLALEACAREGIPVTVLDRPNPLGGIRVEGNLSEEAFRSFIGRYPLPMQHGMTMGELACYARQYWNIPVELNILSMTGWKRTLEFVDCGLPWVQPSPNLPTLDTARVYPGTVLIEGTNLSEGRGTTRPFELIGHPRLQPYRFTSLFHEILEEIPLEGFRLRPATFVPSFEKCQDQTCQGFQVHVTEPAKFKAWESGQWLLRTLYRHLGPDFQWRQPPFEYVYDLLPIDLLNGSALPRQWVENQGSKEELSEIEQKGYPEFMARRAAVLLYS